MKIALTGVNQKEEVLKQLKTISEALDKQTEKKVLNMRPVIDFNGKTITVGCATYFKDEYEMKKYKKDFNKFGIKGVCGYDKNGYCIYITYIPENFEAY